MSQTVRLAVILYILVFVLRVNTLGGIDPTFREEGNPILQPVQRELAAKLDYLLPYPQSAILAGILLGEGTRIPKGINNDFKKTSTIHLVVVSGQNLTILAGFVMSLVTIWGRRLTILITLLVIVLYSLLTGLQVPVLRAGVMAALSYLAQLFGRQGSGSWILALTGGAMLLYNPNWLLNISFQLSFLATLAVVVVAPLFIERFSSMPKILREDFAVSLAAQLLTLPVIVYNFGQLSVIGILVNSLILWCIPFLMISGFISLAVGLVVPFFGQIIGLFPSVLLTYFIDVTSMFAGFPGAGIRVGESSPVLWVGYYLIVGAVIWGMGKSKMKSEKL